MLLVESLQLRVAGAEIPLRRRDLTMTSEPLRRRQTRGRPQRDRGMAQPVRRYVLRETRALRRVPHDALGGPHRHPIRAIGVLLAGHEERRVTVLAERQVAL